MVTLTMKKPVIAAVIGFVIGILLLPIVASFYIYLGYAPVATAASPFPLEKRLAQAALKARIKKEAPKQSPIEPTDDNLLAGAKSYKEYCAVCHGMANQPKTPTAKGMYPPPPQLLHGKGVTDDPVGETFWKVANGIRLTGMPGYGGSLSNTELWEVSLFLARANHLPDSAKAVIGTEPPAK